MPALPVFLSNSCLKKPLIDGTSSLYSKKIDIVIQIISKSYINYFISKFFSVFSKYYANKKCIMRKRSVFVKIFIHKIITSGLKK